MSKFSVSTLSIADVLLVRTHRFIDSRGYFMETFSHRDFLEMGIDANFVQENQSLSARWGTIRGLHFQTPPHAQAKLVRVLKGKIFDVAVDLRRGSPTFAQWCAAILTAEGGEQLFVPRGFAHAFCTLAPNTEVAYKVDDYYAPNCDTGILWNDPDIAIKWPIPTANAILSERDIRHPPLSQFESPFMYGRHG